MAQTATPTATAGAAFMSVQYRYSIELPPGVLTRQWRAAIVAWDGEARIATDSRNVDITGTVDGTLLAWGLAWDGDLVGFSDLVRDNSARFHGCNPVDEPKTFEVDGVAGIGQSDACANDTNAVRAVLLNDGYGLAFRLVVNPDKMSVAFDELVGWLDALTWGRP